MRCPPVAWEALGGVVVGAFLGLLSALLIETRRDQRDARAAARIIQAELIEISLIAASLTADDPYPYPLQDSAWVGQRDRLAVARLSLDDWISLSSFYVANSLVESGGMEPATCAQIQGESLDLVNLLGRFLGKGWWQRLRSRFTQLLKPRGQAKS